MHYHENRLSDLRNETRGLHNYIRKFITKFFWSSDWKFCNNFEIKNHCRTEKISQTIIPAGMTITVGLGLVLNVHVSHQRTLLTRVVVVEHESRAGEDQLVHIIPHHILHHIPHILHHAVVLICQITPPGVEYNCQPGRQFTVAFLSNSTANYLKTLFPISKLKKSLCRINLNSHMDAMLWNHKRPANGNI